MIAKRFHWTVAAIVLIHTRQSWLLLGENRHIAPRDVDDYIAREGHSILRHSHASAHPSHNGAASHELWNLT